MIIGYNYLILDHPINKQQPLSKYIALPKPSTPQSPTIIQSMNQSIQPTILKSPIFSLIFSYNIQQPKTLQPQIHLFPQLNLYENKIQLSLLDQKKQKSYIYQLLKIQNCQCFENILTFIIKIKFIQGNNSKIVSIDKLISLVGSRKLNSHSFQTYSVIKKQLVVQQPIVCQLRYSPKGYVLIKLSRPQQSTSPIQIHKIQFLTWLCQDQLIKNHQTKCIISSKQNAVTLGPKEIYSVMYTLPENIENRVNESIQIPVGITYVYEGLREYKEFKVIKYVKIQ